MKKLTLLLIVLTLFTNSFSQSVACGQFHRKFCDKGQLYEWIYNAQSKSGLFSIGSYTKIRCVIYKGMDYRMSVCAETRLGSTPVFKIFDSRTNELLFDSQHEQTSLFAFQSTSTRQVVVEIKVPGTEQEMQKHSDAACVGFLILQKVTDK